ncbi:restriction endonuclease subunit S [Phocaeicola vulgatus]|jgi:type I restriction enzyme S subunit|nr:restriction endonuclease subunit S [Paraprevotella clara]MBU8981658.1 restriction endonuclease subunit S [Phocaeicola vulgatus]MBV3772030.1 restriction endonuclease subunit S [Bacteroides sp. MSK.17.76]MBU9014986.1 restriction endonuclease subunit S [Phocaeicola vulgatus]MBU9028459.1 restriction endonuclease subunit S [Phocaeicola vulgatus]
MFLNHWVMKSNYKRLGNYIRQVDVRNRDLVVNKLLGLSIAKQFITSIANTTGTDMSTYKIVQPRQFGYVPVTSRNGDKITIALYEGESPCIISQAYIVFEVIDETELLPEYLMMWFRRPEFDRYARFKSHGSAREVFEWSEMCDVMLPVPPIEEQRKIVSEYQAIEQRIENNRRLITTLEETAKAIYRKMFVDDIDPENLSEGWRMGKLGEVITISSGQSLSDKVDIQTDDYKYPVAGASGIIGYSRWHNQNEPFITTGRVGTIGVVNRYLSSAWAADNVLVAKSPYYEYAYQVLKNVNYQKLIGGGVQNLITQTSLTNIEMMIPPLEKIELYVKSINGIAGLSICLDKENWIMECLQTNFLSKLSNY